MASTIDPRTAPTDVKIKLTTGEGVLIEWKDGHRSEYTFPYLRDNCPCATCGETHGPNESKTAPPASGGLPMYKEPAKATQAEPIGHYAIRFQFSDGHNTGIYSFTHFREICPCKECGGSTART